MADRASGGALEPMSAREFDHHMTGLGELGQLAGCVDHDEIDLPQKFDNARIFTCPVGEVGNRQATAAWGFSW